MSVMVLQGCKSTPQKSRPIESGHGRHAVQVASVCGYKLGQKNFNFGAGFTWTVTIAVESSYIAS